ncbi:MAG: WYL domain-containing protein [Treponema sp.]|nr:WYL domain-containing protein [Treponema sp.]
MKTNKKVKKLPKTALPRIYRIDMKIASGCFPNTNDLARICETTISTINRDLAFMREQLRAPIKYDFFNRGFYYTEKTFRLPAGFTTADDLLALSMAKSIFSLYKETPLYEASNNLLQSILTPIAFNDNHGWQEDRIVVPKIASAKVDLAVWETVIYGLKENIVIVFDYKGMRGDESQKRRVRPYQLLFDSGVWYLYGFAEERKATRIFSLSRMTNTERTDCAFSLPTDFRYADFTGDSYFGVFVGQEKMRFAVDCYGDAVTFATERQWAADQKIAEIDDGVRIEFTSTQYDKVLKWVLSCGCNAVPQKPRDLVDDWKWHLKEMRKLAPK